MTAVRTLLALSLLLPLSVTWSQRASSESWEGTLGGRRVLVELESGADSIIGRYAFEGQMQWTSLGGVSGNKGAFTLHEKGTSVVWIGRRTVRSGSITGFRMSGKSGGRMPFSLRRWAETSSTFDHVEHVYTITTSLPRFTVAKPKLAHALNDTLAAHVLSIRTSFIADATAAHADTTEKHEWALDVRVSVSMYTASTLSLLLTRYAYTGGAHGNTDFTPLNLDIRRGAPHPFTLDALFTNPVEARARIAGSVMQSLRRAGAKWVLDGTLQNASALLDTFTVTYEGLVFHVQPYEAGPYVQGPFTVTVPTTVFADLIDTRGPLGYFIVE